MAGGIRRPQSVPAEKKEESQKKRSPNRLIVEEAINDDNSVVALNPAKMEELQIFRGDTVLLKGKMRHDTVCVVLADQDLDEGKIRLNKVVRKNLRVKLGVELLVRPPSVRDERDLRCLDLQVLASGFSVGNLFDIYLKPYFMEAYRPVRKGDLFLVRGGFRPVEFKESLKIVYVDVCLRLCALNMDRTENLCRGTAEK
ncbi:transitional endoplasmic reticulum ATPase, putative, partial [Toxoplasma gondii ME49]